MPYVFQFEMQTESMDKSVHDSFSFLELESELFREMINRDEKSATSDSDNTSDCWIDAEVELENFEPSAPPWKGTRESSLHHLIFLTHDTKQSVQLRWEEDIQPLGHHSCLEKRWICHDEINKRCEVYS